MKTLNLLIACLFFCFNIYGQTISNADFENWVSVPNSFGGMDPQDWKSTNAATAGANTEAISQSTDKYSGTYALALSPLISFSASDTLTAAIALGQAPLNFSNYQLDYAKGGLPFNKKAISINGYYKFSKGSASFDSAYAIVLLKDATGSGYLGTGNYGFSPAVSYKPFQVNIIAQGSSTALPDSLVIAFFYKSNNQSLASSGKLLIDSLSYKVQIVTTGIEEEKEPGFSFYPNPFNETIHLQFKISGNYTVEIFSASGQFYENYLLKNADHDDLNLQDFEKGIYFIRCTGTENGKIFSRAVQKE